MVNKRNNFFLITKQKVCFKKKVKKNYNPLKKVKQSLAH